MAKAKAKAEKADGEEAPPKTPKTPKPKSKGTTFARRIFADPKARPSRLFEAFKLKEVAASVRLAKKEISMRPTGADVMNDPLWEIVVLMDGIVNPLVLLP